MLDLHDRWKAKKTLAEKLYASGVKKRQIQLESELKRDLEQFKERALVYAGRTPAKLREVAPNAPQNMTGDQFVAVLKEQVKQRATQVQSQIKAEAAFPVRFDDGLGKLLDQVMSDFKKGQSGEQRDKTAERALVVMARYRSFITDKKAELDKGDPAIVDLLKDALHEIETLTRNWSRQSAPAADRAVWEDCNRWITRWEDAKKLSQKRHKALPKEAVMFLKAEKYDAYPLKFNRGLGDALRGFKNITSSKDSLSKLRAEVGLSIKAYRSDIEQVEKRYKKVAAKWNDELSEMLQPLHDTLDGIDAEIVRG
ncbi:hypothetical protein KAK06_21140 [Ideonella sp. 4Y11]|uniref:Uncharacterized protein n=1 Tax=Ideonella aquatica TaxID=2824119 RepID=A0A941BLI3_9BURK|nr:hypothetical protein [Ideonella aquatica]MBQ0961467.1 hypothetical protein [Ideonella aquatica]